eukprot:TRINITY_DN6124_c0_g1_i1.p1 TRINITY_DN6124_c0_g1~~TRINITY_DN6124_c0_g1_i1.p1  ORF type:complete len:531 (+),score=141.28 TRINITY_DN6124_c0_g1_i1:105-1595(+)
MDVTPKNQKQHIKKESPPSSASRTKKLFTSGRPPWYDHTMGLLKPLIIGVCGGSASGKTSVCRKIIAALNVRWVSIISQDSFYRGLEKGEDPSSFNFDHPDAFDHISLIDCLSSLKAGKSASIPQYSFVTHSRMEQSKTIYGADVIIVEGILVLYPKALRDLMDIQVFVDTDDDIRLARRLRRDIAERGRDLNGVLTQYNKFVKPSFEEFILPTKKYADIIIPRGSDNEVAIELLTRHIANELSKRGFNSDVHNQIPIPPQGTPLPSQVKVMLQTRQISAIHTILRDRSTSRSDFVFYSDRLSCLLIEYALSQLPVKKKEVKTCTGASYNGLEFDCKLCAVSVLRAGSVMESSLRSICKGISIGKILIQSDDLRRPRLFYIKIPANFNGQHVLLLDPTLASGASSQMAIRVLLDHGIPEENIIFATIIAASAGLHLLASSFPKVTIVTSAVDELLSQEGYILPGIGNFSDRYFGTAELDDDEEIDDIDKLDDINPL